MGTSLIQTKSTW